MVMITARVLERSSLTKDKQQPIEWLPVVAAEGLPHAALILPAGPCSPAVTADTCKAQCNLLHSYLPLHLGQVRPIYVHFSTYNLVTHRSVTTCQCMLYHTMLLAC